MSSSMPDFVPPLLPVLQDQAPVGDEWVHEIKFDGYRVQLRIENGQVRALTRRGFDWTHRFRDIPAAAAALPVRSAIIDGELVCVRANGITSYRDLLSALSGEKALPLHFYAFDLVWLEDTDLRRQRLLERKQRLRDVIPTTPGSPLLHSDHMVGTTPRLLEHFCQIGLEGVVSKRADSVYVSGRHDAWRKSKCRKRRRFVIGGWRRPDSGVAGVGALLLGAHNAQGHLVYAGKVGTGWTLKVSLDLHRQLEELGVDVAPFFGRARPRRALWVRPELVCDVDYAEWEPPHELRHASFKGLREDVPAREVAVDDG